MRALAAGVSLGVIGLFAAGCSSQGEQACQEEKAKIQAMMIEQENIINNMREQVVAADRRANDALLAKSAADQRADDQVAAAREALARANAPQAAPMFVNRRFSTKLQAQLDDLAERFGGKLVGNRLVLDSDLYFDSGNYTLSAHAKAALREVTQVLRSERLVLLIVGHTDSDPIRNPALKSKGINDNRMLSMMRAKSVMDEMQRNGYPDTLMYATGWGDLIPVNAQARSKSDKRMNRRVEILIDTTASNIFGISEIQSITAMAD